MKKINFEHLNIRFDRNEIAGSLGDMGIFIVFLVGVVTISGMNPSPILVFSGIFNIFNGFMFGLPMAIQPMKAIGIIAISNKLPSTTIIAAGFLMGLIILVLSMTRVISKINNYVPNCVVRGIQLGLGLIFLKTGADLIIATGNWSGYDSYFTALLAAVAGFLLLNNRKIPAALVIFCIGILLMLPNFKSSISPDLYSPMIFIPDISSFLSASYLMVIPQLPLTILNSMIATAALVKDYYPEQAGRANIDKIGFSMGLMNLLTTPFGAMPMCHGAGGLAAQHRFGARTGGSVVFLGIVKLLLGLFFGGSVLLLSKSYPVSILGTMIIFGGLELATHIKGVTAHKEMIVMLLVAGTSFTVNMAFGFLVGMILSYYWKFNSHDYIKQEIHG
ncbi:MAG: putative sulfate/molybdate transporter [Candidatus Methanoperedens sp.]